LNLNRAEYLFFHKKPRCISRFLFIKDIRMLPTLREVSAALVKEETD